MAAKVQEHTIITRDFVWDTKYKNMRKATGWRPAMMPEFDPGSEFHVAHDTLEHLNPTDSSLEAEMKAFGVTMYVRGQSHYWEVKNRQIAKADPFQFLFSKQTTDAAEHMYRDFYSFLDEDKRTVAKAPDYGLLDSTSESILGKLLAIGEDGMVGGMGRTATHSGQNWMERVQNAFGWIRIGYRDAQKLYGGLGQDAMGRAYSAIETLVRPTVVHGVGEGTMLTVEVDLSKHSAKATLRFRNDKDVKSKEIKF